MARRHGMSGYVVAALGAAGLVASLWSPWYGFRFPEAAIDQAVQSAQQVGIPANLLQQSADIVRSLGTIHLTAWQVFTVTPAILLVAAVVAGGLSLLTLGGSATGGSRIISLAGLAGVTISLYRLVARPGNTDILHPAWGLYVALASGLVVVAGAQIASAGDRREARVLATPETPTEPAPTSSSWSTAGSVAPPA